MPRCSCQIHLISFKNSSRTGSPTEVDAYVDDSINQHCEYIVNEVLDQLHLLLKKCNDAAAAERRADLSELVHAFFEKSLQLHSQEPSN